MPKVYKYGAFVRDLEMAAVLNAECDAATAYRKELVEIELTRRAAVADAEARSLPDLGRLRKALAGAEAFLELPATDEDRDARKQACALAKELRAQIKPLEALVAAERKLGQDAWDAAMFVRGVEQLPGCGGDLDAKSLANAVGPRTRETIAAELEQVALVDSDLPQLWRDILVANRAAAAATKRARAAKGCCSGTSLLVEQDVNGAKRTPIGFGKNHVVDRVAVKLAPAVPVANLLTTGAFLQFLPMRPGERQTGRKRDPLRRFRLRLGARPEVWVEGSLVFHRPLPADGQIVLVQLVRQRDAQRGAWSLQLTLMTEYEIRRRGNGEALGIALCWETDGDDVINAYGSDGSIFRVPGIVKREATADGLLAHVDRLIDAALPTLAELAEQSDATITRWIDGKRQTLPISEQVSTMGRRGARMVPLAVARALTDGVEFAWWPQWRASRKEAGLDLFAPLAELASWLGVSFSAARLPWVFIWLQKVRHIWTWYRNQRRRSARRRAQFAVLHGNRVFESHAIAVVDGRDLSAVAMRARGQASNAKRQKTAPAALRARLRELYGDEIIEGVVDEPASAARAKELLSQHNDGALAVKKDSKLRRMKQKKQRRSVMLDHASAASRKPAREAAE